MDRDPVKTAVRNAQREQRLGSDAACVLCGERDAAVLRAASPKLLQRHHVLGRAHDSRLTMPVCLNCHARATEGQLRNAVAMQPQDNTLDRLRAALRSLAAFLEESLAAVERWLEDLEEFSSFLDAQLPNWRRLWRTRK